jgi:hypothetical protein
LQKLFGCTSVWGLMVLIAIKVTQQKGFVRGSLPNKEQVSFLCHSARLHVTGVVVSKQVGVKEKSANRVSDATTLNPTQPHERLLDQVERVTAPQRLGSDGDRNMTLAGEPVQPAPVTLFAASFSREEDEPLLRTDWSSPRHIGYPSRGTAPKAPARYFA